MQLFQYMFAVQSETWVTVFTGDIVYTFYRRYIVQPETWVTLFTGNIDYISFLWKHTSLLVYLI